MAIDVQKEIDKAVHNFTQELLKLFREAVIHAVGASGTAPRPAAPAAPAAPVARPRTRTRDPARAAAAPASDGGGSSARGPKSSPEEVRQLGERIVDTLKKAGKNLSASELQGAVDADHGPFHYALSKLKESGRVKQIGERRMARYSLGGKRAKVAAPARKAPRKAPRKDNDEVTEEAPEEAPAEATEASVVDAEFEEQP